MSHPITSTALALTLAFLTACASAQITGQPRTGRKRRIAAGAIAGIVIGAIVLSLLFCLLCFCCFRRRKQRNRAGNNGVLAGPGGQTQQPMRSSGGGLGKFFGKGRQNQNDQYANGNGHVGSNGAAVSVMSPFSTLMFVLLTNCDVCVVSTAARRRVCDAAARCSSDCSWWGTSTFRFILSFEPLLKLFLYRDSEERPVIERPLVKDPRRRERLGHMHCNGLVLSWLED